MELGLRGKVALVAASTDGLGFATAAALATEGASVWIGSRDPGKVASALSRLRALAPSSVVDGAVLDVSDAGSVAAWVRSAAEAFGDGVDALVVNSGGPKPGLFVDLADDDWSGAFELLVLSAVRLVRAALPGLSVRGGAVLVCSSTSVKEPIEGLMLSNSLRSATAAMAQTLSVELAPKGIRVHCLAPGRFATGRVERLDKATAERKGIGLEEARARSLSAIALGRYGDPDEFGRAACWMLSPAASYLTGPVVTLDGGQLKGTW